MKRCLILLQRTGLNINISITDLVFFNITYVKKLNKVNRSVSSEGLCVGFCFACVVLCMCVFVFCFLYGRVQYGPEVGIGVQAEIFWAAFIAL